MEVWQWFILQHASHGTRAGEGEPLNPLGPQLPNALTPFCYFHFPSRFNFNKNIKNTQKPTHMVTRVLVCFLYRGPMASVDAISGMGCDGT